MSLVENRQHFLYESISDTQGTIRAIDVKIGFLLLIAFTPLYSFDKLGLFLAEVYRESYAQSVMIPLLGILWAVTIIVQLMALFGISNPSSKIVGANQLGTFFGGDVYEIGALDVFYNRKITAQRTLQEEVLRLPSTEDKIIEELAFERMKLFYIRKIKMHRSNAAIYLTTSWLLVSAISYVTHLAK